jgi:hypothetical protein
VNKVINFSVSQNSLEREWSELVSQSVSKLVSYVDSEMRVKSMGNSGFIHGTILTVSVEN